MNALVLCGDSGVILLSVKDRQHIDSAIPGRYTVQAPYKAGAGRGNPEFTKRTTALLRFCVMSSYVQIMVGRAGTSFGWAGFFGDQYFHTLYVSPPAVVESLGGELLQNHQKRLPSWLRSNLHYNLNIAIVA
ncbi:hypothetical protein O5282_18570 [Escherichia coli]|nr:hypothetical protein [Escherichia coli]